MIQNQLFMHLATTPPSLRLRLPRPPSANNLYSNIKNVGRVKSKKYKEWIRAATPCYPDQPEPLFTQYVAVIIKAGVPDKRKRDIANIEKPINDYLVNKNILKDDSQIRALFLHWDDLNEAHHDVVVQVFDLVKLYDALLKIMNDQ